MQLLGLKDGPLAEGEGGAGGMAVVVARQPIVDRALDVVGYELLYRPSDTSAPQVDGEQMTANVVLGALAIGLESLVGDKDLFCNAGRGVLVGTTPVTLPPERTVIEVLESVVIDDETVQGCRDLVERGFRLALDDFVWVEGAERLLELVDIVKLDLREVSREEIERLVGLCRTYDVRLVAEKVETDDDVEWARGLGFDLFQGYAIERPKLVHGETIPASTITHMQLAISLLTEDLDFDALEDILRREPGLVVQVLQMASIGAARGLRRQVRTVREALVILGTVRIRQWIALTILNGQKGGSLDGLAVALIRARMCELLAAEQPQGDPEYAFTAGLLSALDQLVSMEMDQIASSMDIDEDLKLAAFRRKGDVGALVDAVATYQHEVAITRGVATGQPHLDSVAAAAFSWAMPYVNTLSATQAR